MKPTYEQLEKSRNNWKSIAEAATMYLRVINGGDADRKLLISEIAKLSEWNAKHIEENDKLKLKIAELEQALTGRTMSCAWCNDTAKQRDEICEAVREFAAQERLFSNLSMVQTNVTYGDERPRLWKKAFRKLCRMVNVLP